MTNAFTLVIAHWWVAWNVDDTSFLFICFIYYGSARIFLIDLKMHGDFLKEIKQRCQTLWAITNMNISSLLLAYQFVTVIILLNKCIHASHITVYKNWSELRMTNYNSCHAEGCSRFKETKCLLVFFSCVSCIFAKSLLNLLQHQVETYFTPPDQEICSLKSYPCKIPF